MVIGEAPGAQEDAEGLPFVGRSGRLLDQLLAAAGLDPAADVYICNGVKCRPPNNRKPTAGEMAACRPWLEQQIAAVDPPLVVLLGPRPLRRCWGSGEASPSGGASGSAARWSGCGAGG